MFILAPHLVGICFGGGGFYSREPNMAIPSKLKGNNVLKKGAKSLAPHPLIFLFFVFMFFVVVVLQTKITLVILRHSL